jgi:cytochrome c oxidase subunit 4
MKSITLRTTIMTGAAVLGLWAVSFGLSFVSLGAAALPIALAIALAKAALVALFFMELAKEALQVKLTLLVAVFLVLLLGALMIADILTRS